MKLLSAPGVARRVLRAGWTSRRAVPTLIHAAAVLLVVELMVRCVPLPRASRMLGVSVDLAPATGLQPVLAPEQLDRRAARQLRCAYFVAGVWPFSRGPCLRRALVGGHLVRRLQPTVRLGMGTTDGRLFAHAWLEIEGRPLEDVSSIQMFQHRSAEVSV